jgi:aminoglycoside 3-N-acetyltransferase
LTYKTFIDLFVHDLISLGVRPGGVLLVHPALRPFGYVPGGADTIIQGLLTVLGDSGTLLMPALSWNNATHETPIFNISITPSCVGVIAETFRVKQGVNRSFHPTHSVCGIGPLAEELLNSHINDLTPCGPNSPFHKLQNYNGQILMLACGLIYNTSLHAVEEIVRPPYLFDPPISYIMIDESKIEIKKEYIPHNFSGWKQRYDRIESLLSPPDLVQGKVGGAHSYLIESRQLWKAALNALAKDKLHFIEKIISS